MSNLQSYFKECDDNRLTFSDAPEWLVEAISNAHDSFGLQHYWVMNKAKRVCQLIDEGVLTSKDQLTLPFVTEHIISDMYVHKIYEFAMNSWHFKFFRNALMEIDRQFLLDKNVEPHEWILAIKKRASLRIAEIIFFAWENNK